MLRYGWLSIPLLMVSINSADAGIFKKKPTTAPTVPELVKTLQSDSDEAKRADAAESLREFDPKASPEIIPALITALQKDASSTVRTAAASTLGKLRPINQQIGFALEQALENDSSIRVRMSARSSLWQYTILGYRSGKTEDPKQEQTGEPPLAPPSGLGNSRTPSTPAKPAPATPTGRVQTQEPPLAPPLSGNDEPPALNTRKEIPVPLPLPAVETPQIPLKVAPKSPMATPIEEEGPSLGPSLNPPK